MCVLRILIIRGCPHFFKVTSYIDELIKSSTPALDEIHVHEENLIHIHEENISDIQDAFVESSTPSHDVRCSLSTPTIEEEIEDEIVATSVDTSKSLGFLLIILSDYS